VTPRNPPPWNGGRRAQVEKNSVESQRIDHSLRGVDLPPEPLLPGEPSMSGGCRRLNPRLSDGRVIDMLRCASAKADEVGGFETREATLGSARGRGPPAGTHGVYIRQLLSIRRVVFRWQRRLRELCPRGGYFAGFTFADGRSRAVGAISPRAQSARDRQRPERLVELHALRGSRSSDRGRRLSTRA